MSNYEYIENITLYLIMKRLFLLEIHTVILLYHSSFNTKYQIFLWDAHILRSTARHAIHFQFDISANGLGKRAVRLIVLCVFVCTKITNLRGILQTWLVVSSLPSDCSLSQVCDVASLVAFYDIHERKREVLFICSIPDTARDRCDMIRESYLEDKYRGK
jgi:hypothetical protein